MTTRRKFELSIAVLGAVFGIWWIAHVVTSVRSDLRAKAAERALESSEPTPNRFDANAKAGEAAGSAMGHMIGKLGKSYPSPAEIETMAKTSAVDAGSTVNDFIFTGAFKRAFASGYREGRKSR